jgi:hypothetical protein
MQDIPFSNLNIFCDLKIVDLNMFLSSHSDAAGVFFLVGRGTISQNNGDFKPG